MKIAFLGSGEFGLPTLQRLSMTHDVVCVVTAPNKTAGRNRKPTATPIGQWAEESGLCVLKTDNVNAKETIQKICSMEVDAMIVIAFGQKLSQELIDAHRTVQAPFPHAIFHLI